MGGAPLLITLSSISNVCQLILERLRWSIFFSSSFFSAWTKRVIGPGQFSGASMQPHSNRQEWQSQAGPVVQRRLKVTNIHVRILKYLNSESPLPIPIFWTHEKGAFLVLIRVFVLPLMTSASLWAPEETCQNTKTHNQVLFQLFFSLWDDA